MSWGIGNLTCGRGICADRVCIIFIAVKIIRYQEVFIEMIKIDNLTTFVKTMEDLLISVFKRGFVTAFWCCNQNKHPAINLHLFN